MTSHMARRDDAPPKNQTAARMWVRNGGISIEQIVNRICARHAARARVLGGTV